MQLQPCKCCVWDGNRGKVGQSSKVSEPCPEPCFETRLANGVEVSSSPRAMVVTGWAGKGAAYPPMDRMPDVNKWREGGLEGHLNRPFNVRRWVVTRNVLLTKTGWICSILGRAENLSNPAGSRPVNEHILRCWLVPSKACGSRRKPEWWGLNSILVGRVVSWTGKKHIRAYDNGYC
jgi:hypothetical protein